MDELTPSPTMVAFLSARYAMPGAGLARSVDRSVDPTFAPREVALPEPPDTSDRLVTFDFSDWPAAVRIELEAGLQGRNIEHVWQGADLYVPDRLEVTVDEVLDGLGRGTDVAAEDPDAAGHPGPRPSETGDLERLDLGSWSPEDRLVLEHRLAGGWPLFEEAWGRVFAVSPPTVSAGSGPVEVPHAWEGPVLLVRDRDVDRAEREVAAVEQAVALALDPDVDKLAYDVIDYTDEQLTTVLDSLAAEGVPHELSDDDELFVREADEALVEQVFDAVDFPDELAAHHDLADPDDGLVAQEVLSELFVAADRLRRDGRNPDAILALVAAAERMDELPVPFGFADEGWTALRDAAGETCRLLEQGDFRPAEVEQEAGRLRELLRPVV